MVKKEQLKNIMLGAAAILLVLGALIWVSRPTPAEQEPPASVSGINAGLAAEEKSFDFGTVSMAAGNASHIFKIRNAGAGALTIKKIYTSCMCTTASLITAAGRKGPFGMIGHGYIPKISQTLAPGEEAQIEVVFDPTAHGPAGVGPVERAVYIEMPSGTQELEIKAAVTP